MRHVVGSILISKYQSWCTLTFLKCIKKGKLCQNATLNDSSYLHVLTDEPDIQHSLPTVDTNVDFALYNREILPTEERNKLNNFKPDKACGPY